MDHGRTVLRIIFTLIVVVTSAASAESVDIAQSDTDAIKTVLLDAEALGLPSLTGASFWRGTLSIEPGPGEPEEMKTGQLHARLADGTWLLNLIEPLAADEADPTEVAALVPLAPATVTDPFAPFLHVTSYAWTVDEKELAVARQYQLGIPVAGTVLAEICARHDGYRKDFSIYPRPPATSTNRMVERVRFACRSWFLDRFRDDHWDARWAQAAVAIAPLRWREQTRIDAQRLHAASTAAIETDPSPASVVRRFVFPRISNGRNFLPEISDDALVSMAGADGS